MQKKLNKLSNLRSSILLLGGGGGEGGVFTVSGVTHYVEFDFGTTFFGFSKEDSRGYMNDLAVQ